MGNRDSRRGSASFRASRRTLQRRSEVRVREERVEEAERSLGRVRTRAESYALIGAAIIGSISLAVTGWGTYWSARVAEDQLQQSAVQSVDRRIDQALKFSYYEEPREGVTTALEWGNAYIIANRSSDPVRYVMVSYVLFHEPVRKGDPAAVVSAGTTTFDVLEPCSQVKIRADEMVRLDGKKVTTGNVRIEQVIFRDRRGVAWEAHPGEPPSEAGQLWQDTDEAREAAKKAVREIGKTMNEVGELAAGHAPLVGAIAGMPVEKQVEISEAPARATPIKGCGGDG
jgi:hypothetical protein